MTQLALDLFPPWAGDRHPNLERLRALDLPTGVFYYAAREVGAGRPCPVKLTEQQRAYVDRWSR